MRGIALNFFPAESNSFTITLYRFPYEEESPPISRQEEAVRRNLEVDGFRGLYWTLFQQTEGGIETVCKPFNNVYVTIDALRNALIHRCEATLPSDHFRVTEGIGRRIEITTEAFPEGKQVVSLEPYLLRSIGKFGFLADFRFRPTEEYRGTRQAQQLSLSLDKNGQQNSNYYADRHAHLVSFVNRFHDIIFPVHLPGGFRLQVARQLVKLSPERLDVKTYMVGADRESKSQFMGVKRNGPLEKCPDDAGLYFIFKEEHRPLSRELFLALRGDTFHTFPGMEEMFHLPVSGNRVKGDALEDFSDREIKRIRDRVVADAAGRKVVPIFLTPFSRHDEPEENEAYWKLKHAFLSKGLPIQVVASETVSNKNKLKWSASGIGLQVFAKLGGIPWKVRPRTDRCLIVGIGQAHQVSESGIERFFAYSVLTNSSGVFEEVRVLGEAKEEEHYYESFLTGLRKIFEDYSDRFSSFVVHSTFKIRRRELQYISEALSERKAQEDEGEFVSIKFNDRKGFFGFAVDHNSRVPYESTMIQLAQNEYLVWFAGLQFGKPAVRGMVGGPLHVEFTFPRMGLTPDQQKVHLQDAINLSGANWRGFNAKSFPVSVYYAQIIARYLKNFEKYDLPELDVNTFTPWFL